MTGAALDAAVVVGGWVDLLAVANCNRMSAASFICLLLDTSAFFVDVGVRRFIVPRVVADTVAVTVAAVSADDVVIGRCKVLL